MRVNVDVLRMLECVAIVWDRCRRCHCVWFVVAVVFLREIYELFGWVG